MLTSSSFSILGPNSIYPGYMDNPFALVQLKFLFNYNVLRYTPYFLFPLAAAYLIFNERPVVNILIVLNLFIISQINQTIYGIDLNLFCFFFICCLLEKNDITSRKSAFQIGLFGLYFMSAVAKLSRPEWIHGETFLFLITTNNSLLPASFSVHSILLKILTYSVLLLEMLSPVTLLFKRLRAPGHLALAFLHLGSLLVLKIPHLSFFLLAIHLHAYRVNKIEGR